MLTDKITKILSLETFSKHLSLLSLVVLREVFISAKLSHLKRDFDQLFLYILRTNQLIKVRVAKVILKKKLINQNKVFKQIKMKNMCNLYSSLCSKKNIE